MFNFMTDPRTYCALTIALAVATTPLSPQEQRYRERQTLDPDTGQWETAPTTDTPTTGLGEVRRLLAIGEPKEARDRVEAWLETVPDESRYYEAVLLLGETYFESGDFWKALEQYNVVAENASGELFREANRRSVDVARAFLSGEKRIVWRIFRLPAYDEGIEILDRVWERMPGTPLGEFALKLRADYFFRRGEVDIAQDEYANLAQQYPSGRFYQLALLRTAEAADAAFPGVKFDDLALIEAQQRYARVQAEFPAFAERERIAERLDGIRELRAQKDLEIGKWYERTDQPAAAEFYYRAVLVDWPNTLAAAEARTRLLALGIPIEQIEEAAP